NPNGYVAIDSTMYFSSDCTSVSVDELSSESVLIYPNPATNHITVDLNGLEEPNGVLKIYDLSGRLGLEKLANSVATIDVSYLVKGVYTLEVSTSDKVLRSHIVIE
ncbi:MAG: T9SS type A sorting domain-containing protein, partial [Flavobacteriales bacterium]